MGVKVSLMNHLIVTVSSISSKMDNQGEHWAQRKAFLDAGTRKGT